MLSFSGIILLKRLKNKKQKTKKRRKKRNIKELISKLL
jgi:hypothetical protein